jgi:O-antigen/teichoic acid export membrane protein
MNRAVLLTVAARLAVVLTGIASGIVTARVLGPGGRGEYFVIVTFATLLVQLTNLGIHSSNTYLAARDPGLIRPLAANSLWIALGLGSAAASLAAFAGQWWGWLPAEPDLDVWLGVALVPPTLYGLLGSSLLVAVGRFTAFNVYQVLSNLAAVAALALAWRLGAGVTGLLAAAAAAWWASGLALHLLVARSGQGSWRFRTDVLRSSVWFAGKAYLTCLIGFLLARANVLLLPRWCGDAETGFYSVAVQVADAMWILPGAVGLVLFPALVRQQQSRWETSARLLARVAVLMAAACLVCALLIGPFVRLAFGPQFEPAVAVVLWMLPGIFCYALTSVISQFLAASGLPAAVVGIWLVGLGVLGVASWQLVPEHGAVGAAISLSAANLAVCGLQWALAWWMQAAPRPAAAPQTHPA